MNPDYLTNRGQSSSSSNVGQLVDAQLTTLIGGGKIEPDKLHRFTLRFLAYLRQRDWLPLATQIPLCHRSGTIHTWIDVLAYDFGTKTLVLVELKTGYEAGYYTPIRLTRMRSDLFEDSEYMRHQQQLAWMMAVLQANVGDETKWQIDGCVIRVNDRVVVHEPHWCDAAVYELFKNTYVDSDSAYNSKG